MAELMERSAQQKRPTKKQPAPAVIEGKVQRTEPYMTVEEITPERAQELLGHNLENRNVSQGQVNELAEAMTNEMFVFDGAPIRIAPGGRLLDGQHRLLAILKSGTTQKLAVWWNVPEHAQNTMDTGRKRSIADALKLRGEKDTAVLGAVLGAGYRWDKGLRGTAVMQGSKKVPVQHPMLLAYLEEHPEIRDGIRASSRVRALTRAPMSVLAFAYFLFSRIDDDAAEEDAAKFFDMLATGEGLRPGHPIHTLRQQWMRLSVDRDRVPSALYLAQMIRAWNAFRDGEDFWKFSIRLGGARPSDFPEPH